MRRVLALVVLLAIPAAATAQDGSSLRGRHQVMVLGGTLTAVRSGAALTDTGVPVDADVTAVFPGLGYAWWVSERAAVGVRVGVLHVSSDVRPQPATVVHETATVMPVLLHLRLQPFLLTASNRIRPYVTLGLGPVIAHATNVYTGANQNLDSVNEMAIGSLAAAGVDGSVTSRLVVGLDAGFWFIPEFAWRVGPEAGWSSPVVMVSVGWLLGGGDR